MRVRFVAMLVVALYAIPAGVSRGAAQVSDDDLSMLGLVFRNRFVPFAEARRSAELTSIVLRVSELGRDGDRVERYKAMIEGMARMSLGSWDEGAEVASNLDVDLSAKAYEPGGRVPVRIAPLYERSQALMAGYSIQLALVAPGGAEVYAADPIPFDALAVMAGEVVVPRDAGPGRYLVRYSIVPSRGSRADRLDRAVDLRDRGARGASLVVAVREPARREPARRAHPVDGTRTHDCALVPGPVRASAIRVDGWCLHGISRHPERDVRGRHAHGRADGLRRRPRAGRAVRERAQSGPRPTPIAPGRCAVGVPFGSGP